MSGGLPPPFSLFCCWRCKHVSPQMTHIGLHERACFPGLPPPPLQNNKPWKQMPWNWEQKESLRKPKAPRAARIGEWPIWQSRAAGKGTGPWARFLLLLPLHVVAETASTVFDRIRTQGKFHLGGSGWVSPFRQKVCVMIFWSLIFCFTFEKLTIPPLNKQTSGVNSSLIE